MSCYKKILNIKWMDKITKETFWIGLKKREHFIRIWRREESSDDRMHVETRKIAMGILKGEVGRKRRIPGLEYFPQIMKDMWCGTFREMKE